MFKMLMRIWKDPVWSSVIAAILLAFLSFVSVKYRHLIAGLWENQFSRTILTSAVGVILVLLLVRLAVNHLRAKKKLVVFVSVGGTCRDPIAKIITERLLKENGISKAIDVMAMAVNDGSDLRVSYGARHAVMNAYNEDLLVNHKCRVVTREVVDRADLILTMSSDVQKALMQKFPDAKNAYLLKEFFGIGGDVENPWPDGRDEVTLEKYKNCFRDLESTLTKNFDKLANALKA